MGGAARLNSAGRSGTPDPASGAAPLPNERCDAHRPSPRPGSGGARPHKRGGDRLTDRISIALLASEFPADLVDEVVAAAGAQEQRRRGLPARLTVYYVLAMALFGEDSYDEVMRLLAEALGWLSGWARTWQTPTVPAITKARARLGEQPMALLLRRTIGPFAAKESPAGLWRGLRPVTVDSVVLDVPDTVANAAAFAHSDGADPTPPRPRVRVTAVAECSSGALLAATVGAQPGDEPAAADGRVRVLPGDALLLTDHRHGDPARWHAVIASGGLCCRVRSAEEFGVLETLPDGSYLSRLGGTRPTAGGSLPVRVIEYERAPAGQPPAGSRRRSRGAPVTLVTTLLDPVTAPAHELAAVYAGRWRATTILASLRAQQGGADMLVRSKRPAMVRQEIWGMLCVYQAIRRLMWQTDLRDSGYGDTDTWSLGRALRVLQHADRRDDDITS